jgi:hypothetical protein
MVSYKTFKFRNNTSQDANDIHIEFDMQVEVKGVDGVSPSDPNAKYTLEGDGTGSIDISSIDKKKGDSIEVRIKGNGRNAPTVRRVHWTKDGKNIGNATTVAMTFPVPEKVIALTSKKPRQAKYKK